MSESAEIVLAREIMTPHVICVQPDIPVDEVARILLKNRITGVPVIDSEGRVLGVVSEFDLLAKRGRLAKEVMTAEVIAVTEETPAETVAELIVRRRVRRVPVLRDGRVVGIITRADLVRLFAVTRWTCTRCGYFERGLHRPLHCASCGGTEFRLDREPPGM